MTHEWRDPDHLRGYNSLLSGGTRLAWGRVGPSQVEFIIVRKENGRVYYAENWSHQPEAQELREARP